jgi:CSLREA domain-containing protein
VKRAQILIPTIAVLVFASIGAYVLTVRANVAASPALATANTYTVNSNDDVDDGICGATHCSLREAINAANSHAGLDTILFDFPSATSILPTSALPEINDPVTIDAVALGSAHCASAVDDSDLQVTLSGFLAGDVSGLRLGSRSDGSTIKGLAIVLFEQFGIVVEDFSESNTIRCNHIGIDAHGNAGLANGQSGILINGDYNTVGGDAIDARNVISGNGQVGVLLTAISDFNTVAGNYIGTKADGVRALGNAFQGITIWGDTNTIGGFNLNERNVIAANGMNGIYVNENGDAVQDNLIINNYIGVDRNGAALGNAWNGIYLNSGSGTTVGNSSAPNLIAHNGYNGIRVGETSVENALRVNIIRDNGLLGIDLMGSGEAIGEVTINDTLDSDTGANQLQNYPILASADITGHVLGTLYGAPGNDISLFFYINNRCDGSGYGEGETFRQAVDVTIPSGGVFFLDITLNSPPPAGKYLVATAIDIDTKNTSEFSNCIVVSDSTYVVDSTANTADANPGDGVCDITGTSTDCTLRAAIMEANASTNSGPIRIEFDIPGAGPHVISPPNDFDDITKPVTIDGETQPGASCPVGNDPANLQVILDGSSMSSGNGLTLASGSDGSEIRGLAITNFPGHGIEVASDNNVIACNHIGIDQSGTADAGNALNGVLVTGSGNRVGGLSRSARNVLSGNDLAGILLGTGAADNMVQGNFVGTDAAGESAVGNTEAGVRLNTASDNRIGGIVGTALNIVSGNLGYGIHLRGTSDHNHVYGNRVGTDRTGTLAIPNLIGIYVRNSNDNEIGGDTPEKGNLIAGNTYNGLHLDDGATNNLVQNNTIGLDAGANPLGNGSIGVILDLNVSGTDIFSNTIAYNGMDGVRVLTTSTGNSIRYNSIFKNAELGIDLENDEVTPNDGAGDADTGANNLQNYPVLILATPNSGEIGGELISAASSDYLVDFYRSAVCDPSGNGEGWNYLGSRLLTTNAGGSLTFNLDIGGFAYGEYISATATDSNGNTSEFSNCVMAGEGEPSPTPTATFTSTATLTPTPTVTPGPSPTPTLTAIPGPSPTPTQTPTEGPSPTPTTEPSDDQLYLPIILR